MLATLHTGLSEQTALLQRFPQRRVLVVSAAVDIYNNSEFSIGSISTAQRQDVVGVELVEHMFCMKLRVLIKLCTKDLLLN